MASSLLDVCRFNPAAGGTTDWTYSSAVTGYQSPAAAGAVNGAIYSYRAESNDLTQWEVGYGAYNSGAGILARTTILFNSAGSTAKINFSTVPQIAIVALGEDLLSFNSTTSLSAGQQAQGRANLGVEKKNYIVNGAMMVSQENGTTAGSASGYYPVDMFLAGISNTTGTISAAQVSSTTPAGSNNRLRITVTSADASVGATDVVYVQTKIEGFRVADLKIGTASAKTVTLQFGVKAPAGSYSVVFGNSLANRTYVAEYTIAAGEANTDVVKFVTVALDTTPTGWTTGNGIGLYVDWGLMAGSTFQQAAGSWGTVTAIGSSNQFNLMGTNGNVFELFDVGLYEGAAPSFTVPDFGATVRDCMRYWEKTYAYGDPPGSNSVQSAEERIVNANPLVSGADVGGVRFRVEKRTAPTVTVYGYSGTAGTISNQAGVDQAANTGGAVGVGSNSFVVRNNSGGSVTLNNQVALFQWKADARL